MICIEKHISYTLEAILQIYGQKDFIFSYVYYITHFTLDHGET